jgi:hypothetical protein
MAYKRISPQPVVEGGTGQSTLTNHGVLIGAATAAITQLSVGTNGQVLVGSSAADPVFATLTSSSLTYTTGAGSLAINITAPVSIANGGTNATSMATTDGTVYFDGTRLVTTATGTANQVLTSNGAGVAPTFQAAPGGSITITGDSGGGLTGTSFTFTGGSTGLTFSGAGTTETLTGTLAIANGGTNATSMATTDGTVYFDGTRLVTTATGTSGQFLMSQGAGVAPVYATATVNLFPWTVVTGATQAISINNGYFANNAGTCVMTLPATAAVGSVVRVAGMNNATGWQIAQNSGQTIHFGNVNTTTGATGFLSSTATYDSVELVCNIANTDWVVIYTMGNITYN